MKTTDLWPILNAVRNIEKKELADALKQHGGEYDFTAGDRLQVEFYSEGDGPSTITVTGVQVTGDEKLIIYGDFGDDEGTIEADAVYPGHLSLITATMADPEEP